MSDDGELFAGPGGWGVAELLLGIRTKGLEWDDAAVATATAAGLIRLVDADGKGLNVATADPETIFPNGLRLLIGSPPCQAFSPAGKGLGRKMAHFILMGVQLIAWGNDPTLVCKWVDEQMHDDRAALVLEPLRWALALRPEYIALEQVAAVLPLWEAIAGVLRQHGYSVWCGNLQAEQYDVPQTRKRAILIASRVREVSAPPPVRSRFYPRTPGRLDPDVLPWISWGAALGVLGDSALRSNYGTGGDPRVRGVRTSDRPAATVTSKIDRFKFAGAGATSEQTAGQIPRSSHLPAHTITGKGTAALVFRGSNQAHAAKRPSDRPAPTVKFSNRSNKVELMDPASADDPAASGQRVSVVQAASLQGFPAGYPWRGNNSAKYRQVGDAMPPPLAWHVLRALFGLPVQHYPGTEHL